MILTVPMLLVKDPPHLITSFPYKVVWVWVLERQSIAPLWKDGVGIWKVPMPVVNLTHEISFSRLKDIHLFWVQRQ